MPVRIQLRRTKGWRKPPNTVVVARPTKWGNPFKSHPDGVCLPRPEEAVADFRAFLTHTITGVTLAQHAKTELRGKNLACWCRIGSPCHADVLLEIANAP